MSHWMKGGGSVDRTLLQLEARWIYDLRATAFPGFNESLSFRPFYNFSTEISSLLHLPQSAIPLLLLFIFCFCFFLSHLYIHIYILVFSFAMLYFFMFICSCNVFIGIFLYFCKEIWVYIWRVHCCFDILMGLGCGWSLLPCSSSTPLCFSFQVYLSFLHSHFP